MLRKISIQHFRSIESLDLSLGQTTVLVGRNGAGKSNIVDAIKFVRDALNVGLDQAITDRHGIETIRKWSKTRPYDIKMTFEVEVESASQSGEGTFLFILSSTKDSYSIKREEGRWTGERTVYTRSSQTGERRAHKILSKASYVRDKNGNVSINDASNKEARVIPLDNVDDFFLNSRFSQDFLTLRMSLSRFEAYSIFPNTLREAQKQSREEYLMSHGENVFSILKKMRRLRKSDAISEINRAIGVILKDFDHIQIRGFGGFLAPEFFIKSESDEGSHIFNANQMSDGTLRVLGLMVALYQEPRPDIIVLEEPEISIHPGVLKVIAESIREVSENTQILITTHNPHLLEFFKPEEIVAVEYDNSCTTTSQLRRYQIDAVKESLFTLGELMSIEGLHA